MSKTQLAEYILPRDVLVLDNINIRSLTFNFMYSLQILIQNKLIPWYRQVWPWNIILVFIKQKNHSQNVRIVKMLKFCDHANGFENVRRSSNVFCFCVLNVTLCA